MSRDLLLRAFKEAERQWLELEDFRLHTLPQLQAELMEFYRLGGIEGKRIRQWGKIYKRLVSGGNLDGVAQ